MSFSSILNNQYKMIKTIGEGNFAKVKLAINLSTYEAVAVKIMNKTAFDQSILTQFYREVEIMKQLRHPNIIRLFQVFETDRTLYLVLEYASGGEVYKYLTAHGRMEEKVARVLFRQMVSAVQYLHAKGIVHRDLKAENLLLDEDMNVKIADFGFSNLFSAGNTLDTYCGSPPYAAPELFQGQKYHGPEVDVWSLGVILYSFVTGKMPFEGQTHQEIRDKVMKGKYHVPSFLSIYCVYLLRKLLVLNPAKRSTLDVIMQDQWLNTGYEAHPLRPYKEDEGGRNTGDEQTSFKRGEPRRASGGGSVTVTMNTSANSSMMGNTPNTLQRNGRYRRTFHGRTANRPTTVSGWSSATPTPALPQPTPLNSYIYPPPAHFLPAPSFHQPQRHPSWSSASSATTAAPRSSINQQPLPHTPFWRKVFPGGAQCTTTRGN